MATAEKQSLIQLTDLPLYCPTKEMTLWNTHPRVFLEIEATGKVICPYCGTHFILDTDVKDNTPT
jgi:uncharacterized Zn-finger protein